MTRNHILKNLNPYGVNFPNYIDKIIDDLTRKFQFSKSELDMSVDSLSLFDVYFIEKKPIFDTKYINDIILGLVAYTGQSYIYRNGGHWKMKLNEDGETWIPIVVSKYGYENEDYIAYLYSTLLEDEYPSIYAASIFQEKPNMYD